MCVCEMFVAQTMKKDVQLCSHILVIILSRIWAFWRWCLYHKSWTRCCEFQECILLNTMNLTRQASMMRYCLNWKIDLKKINSNVERRVGLKYPILKRFVWIGGKIQLNCLYLRLSRWWVKSIPLMMNYYLVSSIFLKNSQSL